MLLDRREFLRRSAAVGLGVGLGSSAAAADDSDRPTTGIQRYPELGRTGLRVSDISFGSSRLRGDPDLVRHALDHGVTYFDTAQSYRGGASETAIGEALKGQRDRVILGSKVKCGTGTRQAELMQALEESLRRLQTDRIELYFNHAVNDVARLRNPEWLEFTEKARQQGKIRFVGMSGHGGRLVECLDVALDEDLVDVILVAYNFGQDPAFYERFTRSLDFVAIQPELPRVLEKARKKNVGVIAMKTLMGARLNDMRPYEREGHSFAQAAFRWVLSDTRVDALIVSMTERARIDEYLAASGKGAPRAEHLQLLERYVTANGRSYCRHGCLACANACPTQVPIAEVLRARMYAVDYADRELARDTYARLERGASACVDCAPMSCRGACPYGLALPELTRFTHRMLSDA